MQQKQESAAVAGMIVPCEVFVTLKLLIVLDLASIMPGKGIPALFSSLGI